MKLNFEYGQGTMAAELPDSTDVFIPGETVSDPPYIPEEQLIEKTRESVRNPIGMPALSETAHKGSTVTIVIPDIIPGMLNGKIIFEKTLYLLDPRSCAASTKLLSIFIITV